MYNSDLEELIAYYELEKQNLEVLMTECVKEMDYKFAEYHKKALFKTEFQLHTLYILRDPDHDFKESINRWLNYYQEKLDHTENDRMKEHFKTAIIDLEARLELLNESKINSEKVGQEFDNAIYDLVEGYITGFRFHLQKIENLYLEFRHNQKEFLTISFKPTEKASEHRLYKKKHLKGLGFYRDAETGSFKYNYDLKNFNDSKYIKMFVSRIIFEVFSYTELDNPAAIEFF